MNNFINKMRSKQNGSALPFHAKYWITVHYVLVVEVIMKIFIVNLFLPLDRVE